MSNSEQEVSALQENRGNKVLPAVLIIMILLSGAMSFALLSFSWTLSNERRQSTNMSQTISELEEALARESDRNREYATMLDNYQQLVLSYQKSAVNNLTNATSITSNLNFASVVAPAVMTVASGSWFYPSYSYQGVITNLSLEIVPGRGRVLVNTEPLMGEVFQDTAILAKETAEMISGKSLGNYDLIFSISAPAEIPGVDGPSAGAAMCLLALSIIDDRMLRSDIALTGTIQPDGTIGAIGGLAEKAQAALDAGSTLFFIPGENSQMTIYEEGEIKRWGRIWKTQVPVQVDTEEYIETNVGIEVEIVENIGDLISLATPI
jgi:hypothetical protein